MYFMCYEGRKGGKDEGRKGGKEAYNMQSVATCKNLYERRTLCTVIVRQL